LPDPYCPEQDEIVWLDFDPQAGREQAGRRPALVLSPRRYNAISRLCVVCPITTKDKGWKLASAVPSSCSTTGFVLTDQLKSMSWEQRKAAFIEAAPPALVADVRAKVKALLNLR